MNTTIEFEFCDGTKTQLTLTFYALYQLKSRNKALYDRYNLIMSKATKGNYDELDMIAIVYTAYLCANYHENNLLTEEEFIIKCGSNRKAISNAVRELQSPKKPKAFASHLSKEHSVENTP